MNDNSTTIKQPVIYFDSASFLRLMQEIQLANSPIHLCPQQSLQSYPECSHETKAIFQLLNFNEIIYHLDNVRLQINNSSIPMYSACLLYTSPSPRDGLLSRMPSSA
eukprot:TRINITY_DN5328_c0_g2_i3.p1 TRINITY_DN5328_c0_g2~~TRINITY_DN5328_c0_g2_i3.p1  ORF type:complete len:107 (+),score=5.26 TRINITY_DN5328_c0_g2_i3:251-571(+)